MSIIGLDTGAYLNTVALGFVDHKQMTTNYEAVRQIEWGFVVQPDQLMLADEIA